MRAKALYIGWCTLFLSLPICAQQVTVSDEREGTPLPDVIVRVYDSNREMTTYTISNEKGKANVTTDEHTAFVRFSLLGYTAQEITPQQLKANPTVKMRAENVVLKEIVVRAPPVQRNKDTLNYNISSFAGQQDRYMVDVLKRLPGITVADNGSIAYQGKPINKFYIEGQDLLGSRYGQATNNLPIEAVAQVQILENNQPIKALENKEFSDRAALNVRLKKGYRLRPFGEVKVSGGAAPFLWDNKLFLTQVATKQQFLISGEINNTGKDISQNATEQLNISNLFAYEPLPPEAVSTAMMSTPWGIPPERSRKNKSIVGGVNHLAALSKYANLRTNLVFYNNKQTQQDSTRNSYGGEQPFLLTERKSITLRTTTFAPAIQYELNSPNVYLVNELKAYLTNDRQSTEILSNNSLLSEHTKQQPSYVQNMLRMIFNHKGKSYNLQSFVRYYNRRDRLDVSDDENLYDANERPSMERFFTKNRLSASYPLWKGELNLNLNMSYRHDTYDTGNDVHGEAFTIGLSPSYSIDFGGKNVLQLSVPFSRKHIRIGDTHRRSWNYAPAISWNKEWTHRTKTSLSFSHREEDMGSNFYYTDRPLLHNYRTLYLPTTEIERTRQTTASLNVSYVDLITMFFANITGALSYRQSNCYYDYRYEDKYTTATLVKGNNPTYMLMLSGVIDKSFIGSGISLKSSTDYQRNQIQQSQFGTLYRNTSNRVSETLNVNYTGLSWLKLFYTLTGDIQWQDQKITEQNSIRSLHQQLKVFIMPHRKVNLTLSAQHSSIETAPRHFEQNLFCDIDGRYLLSKRIEASFRLSNLFDRKGYSTFSNSGMNTSFYHLSLRGRECLFSLLVRI